MRTLKRHGDALGGRGPDDCRRGRASHRRQRGGADMTGTLLNRRPLKAQTHWMALPCWAWRLFLPLCGRYGPWDCPRSLACKLVRPRHHSQSRWQRSMPTPSPRRSGSPPRHHAATATLRLRSRRSREPSRHHRRSRSSCSRSCASPPATARCSMTPTSKKVLRRWPWAILSAHPLTNGRDRSRSASARSRSVVPAARRRSRSASLPPRQPHLPKPGRSR
jgi:hypothetical protein